MKRFQFEDMKTLRIFGEAVSALEEERGRAYVAVNSVLPSNHPLVIERRNDLREILRTLGEVNEEVHRLHVLGRCPDKDCTVKTVEDSARLLSDSRTALTALYARLDADQEAGDALGPMDKETAVALALVTLAEVAPSSVLPDLLESLGANITFVDMSSDGAAVVVSKFEDGK